MIDQQELNKYVEVFRPLYQSDVLSYNDLIVLLSKIKVAENYYWEDISELVLRITGISHSGKYYSQYSKKHSELSSTEFEKERFKLAEERNQLRAYIRRLSREDTIKEIAEQSALTIAKSNPFIFEINKGPIKNCAQEAILLISDWHYGLEINSYFNEFNEEIAKERIVNLFDEVAKRCIKEGIDVIHILNLGDLIAGRIHLPLRIESRVDTISQIMSISEILSQCLYQLSSIFTVVHYYSCTDNHSRIEPNKTDSIELENLSRITDWYIKNRFTNSNVIVHENTFGEDIINLNVLGHSIIAVHGDKDKPADAISKLSNFTRNVYEAVFMSHRHHFSADEECGTIVIGNGSLMGTDNYAKSLRLHSEPSQTLIIATKDRVADQIIRITL